MTEKDVEDVLGGPGKNFGDFVAGLELKTESFLTL
jgi:hypothetical protein